MKDEGGSGFKVKKKEVPGLEAKYDKNGKKIKVYARRVWDAEM